MERTASSPRLQALLFGPPPLTFPLAVNMRTSRRIIIFVAAVGLAATVGYAFLKPTLDRDPRSNLGYVAWKAGLHSYSPVYAGLMLRDTAFSQSVVGERLDDVVARYRLSVHEGAMFPATSYRGRYQQLLQEREPEVRCYWLDDQAEAFGWCLWVEKQRIKRWMLVKG